MPPKKYCKTKWNGVHFHVFRRDLKELTLDELGRALQIPMITPFAALNVAQLAHAIDSLTGWYHARPAMHGGGYTELHGPFRNYDVAHGDAMVRYSNSY